ncbi:MAG: HTH domain-containing protein [Bryobacteraceae bacterium]
MGLSRTHSDDITPASQPQEKRRPPEFLTVPLALLRDRGRLSFGALMLYGRLKLWQGARKANFAISQSSLAQDLDVSERQIWQLLQDLRESGLVTWKRRKNQTCLYTILAPQERKNSSDPEIDQEPQFTSDQDHPQDSQNTSNSKPQKPQFTSARNGRIVPELSCGNKRSTFERGINKEEKPQQHARAKTPEGTGDVVVVGPSFADINQLLKKDGIKKWFKWLRQYVGNEQIGLTGQRRILRAAIKYGFNLGELGWAFERIENGGPDRQAGGLILFAEDWELSTAGLRIPNCIWCSDSGLNINRNPCSDCEAGKQRAHSNGGPHAA